jgi:hypothetical protein
MNTTDNTIDTTIDTPIPTGVFSLSSEEQRQVDAEIQILIQKIFNAMLKGGVPKDVACEKAYKMFDGFMEHAPVYYDPMDPEGPSLILTIPQRWRRIS